MAKRSIVNSSQIDYKNIKLVKNFISRYGKIVSRQYTSVSLKDQKKLARAIKNARYMALIPFVR
jgi:small subunit ribosomal protein S18